MEGASSVARPFRFNDRQVLESMNMVRFAIANLVMREWLNEESGQDLLEYALLVALIALVAAGAVTSVGTTINTVFWVYIDGVVSAI